MSIYSEEFEAWFAARFWHECYEDVKHHLFAAWQESRKQLVVELPAKNPLGGGGGDCEGGRPSFEQHCAAECNSIIDECRAAIQLTGAKVK